MPTNEDETDPRNTEDWKRGFDCLGEMVKKDAVEQRCGDDCSEEAGEEEDATHEASSHIRIPVWCLCHIVSWTEGGEESGKETHEYLSDKHRKARCSCNKDTEYKKEDEEIESFGSRHELLALPSSKFDRTKVKVECCAYRLANWRGC